jgi:psp operon transcriptional activator
VQEKLLRVVEYGTFERVGGNETLSVDVRIVAATNADLPALAANGRFRADLLDRLAFDVVNVPPLRARRPDILVLAEHFARRMTSELKRPFFAGFGSQAQADLLAHDWPGNVRELRNVIERSVARAERPDRLLDRIVIDPFMRPSASHEVANPVPPAGAAAAAPAPVSHETVRDFLAATRRYEAQLLADALAAHRFSQKRAAESLGLTYYQFRHHLRVHGMLGGKGQAPTGTVAS